MNNKTFYIAMAVVGAFSVSVGAFAQQDQTTTTTTTTVTTPAAGETMVMTTDANRMSVGDRIFLMNLVHANAREIELSRVAFHQANSPEVSRFAHHMLMEHRTLQDQLMATYGERPFLKNWQGAVSMSNEGIADNWGGMDSSKPGYNNWAFLYSEDWSQIHQLRNENGNSLERMYVNWMASDHAKLLAEINRRDMETDNTAIKALISTVRPIVEGHLKKAREMSFDYSGTNSFRDRE